MHKKNLIYNWLAKKSDPSPGSGSKHLLSPGLVSLINIFLGFQIPAVLIFDTPEQPEKNHFPPAQTDPFYFV